MLSVYVDNLHITALFALSFDIRFQTSFIFLGQLQQQFQS